MKGWKQGNWLVSLALKSLRITAHIEIKLTFVNLILCESKKKLKKKDQNWPQHGLQVVHVLLILGRNNLI